MNVIVLAYFRPRDAWWFLTHNPRVLWGIARRGATVWFSRSGRWQLSGRDRDLMVLIADRLCSPEART